MQIFNPVFPRNNSLNGTVKSSNKSLNSNMSYPNLKPLPCDTVSFGNKLIQHAFEQDYSSQLPMLKGMGQKLISILEETCAEVKGAVFDREYCEKAVNKSIDRYMEKLRDSGSIPMDRIRSTVFIKDLYDFSIITNYIKALEKKGFYILPVPDKTAGKKVLSWKYDFDVRLNDDDGKLVSPEEIKRLPAHLRGYISKKQKSGYKDIQMRVVDASHLPKDQRTPKNLSKLIPQEIIFIFGRHTADAKTNESHYVYNITRKLSKMHILNGEYNSRDIYRIREENVGGIGSILRSNISKPLYRNAERLDVSPNETHDLEPVFLQEQSCHTLRAHIMELETRTTRAYSKLRKMILASDYDIEIEKMIKATHEYKTRHNKRVTDEEIATKRAELLKELKEHRTEDLQTISDQMLNMEATIQKYGIKDVDLKAKLEEKLAKLDKTIEKILSNKVSIDEHETTKLQRIQMEKNKIKKQLADLEKQFETKIN